MKDPTLRFVVGAVLLIASVIVVLWATSARAADETLCVNDAGVAGLLVADRCYTVDDYNALYSAEHLATVPALVSPGRSVADVYGIPSSGADSSLPEPADRPGEFMGKLYPSFAELIERVEEAADNPAFR